MKGVQQGNVLSPLLFNLNLDFCLKDNKILKQAIKEGKLACFADDCLLICDDVNEAKSLIREMESLTIFGLYLNK